MSDKFGLLISIIVGILLLGWGIYVMIFQTHTLSEFALMSFVVSIVAFFVGKLAKLMKDI